MVEIIAIFAPFCRPPESKTRNTKAMAEVDLTQVQGQVGTATLDVSDGKVLRSTGELEGEVGRKAAATIFGMLQDTAKCLRNEPMRRLSISSSDHVWQVTISDKYVYVVKVLGAH